MENSAYENMMHDLAPKQKSNLVSILIVLAVVAVTIVAVYSSVVTVAYKDVGIVYKLYGDEHGLQEKVLIPGVHISPLYGLLNDIYYVDPVKIPMGYVGVVTRNDGVFIDSAKLGPGIYRINTHMFNVRLVDTSPLTYNWK